MRSQLSKISVKYAVAFVGVAIALLAVLTADQWLVQTVTSRMNKFSGPFAIATSAILNADRDLYQARIATLNYLDLTPGSPPAKAMSQSHKDNAQQAFDRLEKFKKLWAQYPQVLATLNGFESAYRHWLSQAQQVLSLYNSGHPDAAQAMVSGPTKAAFSDLRAFYNKAGEVADAEIQTLAEATRAHVRYERVIVITASLVVAVLAIVIALVGPLMMSRAIRRVTKGIRDITDGDGDLTARINSRRNDEIGDLARRFDEFIAFIDQTLQTVRNSSEAVTHASVDIAQGSQDLAARTEESASALEQTSASMEEISATVKNAAESAEQGNTLANDSETVVRQGAGSMRDLEKTMDGISGSAEKISEITSLIDTIAFQTNLLALNASVEAARAGEQGRGFAVVAGEVRALAERAGTASRDIRELVDTSVSRIGTGAKLAKTTGSTMQEILQHVEKVSEVMTQIARGAKEQSKGVDQISTTLSELDTATQENASLVEQTSAAANTANHQALELTELITHFRLSDRPAPEKKDSVDPAHSPGRAA